MTYIPNLVSFWVCSGIQNAVKLGEENFFPYNYNRDLAGLPAWHLIQILTITIGFLAPLVLGNAYACIHVPSAPRAWPPKNLYNYNRVSSTAGPWKHVSLHTHSLGPSGWACSSEFADHFLLLWWSLKEIKTFITFSSILLKKWLFFVTNRCDFLWKQNPPVTGNEHIPERKKVL